jgi:uncharacterized protein (TIGR03437 family)
VNSLRLGFLLAFGLSLPAAQTYVISTFAGGAPPSPPLNQVALATAVPNPWGIVKSGDNVYFTAGNCVYQLAAGGILTRIAGTGQAGFSGDGDSALAAQLNTPAGIAVARDGSIYIADSGNNRIRRVMTTGTMTTVAGSGETGYSGDSGPAIAAKLASPVGVVLDSAGTLYIADSGNYSVRRVGLDGTITTIAGTGSYGKSPDHVPGAGAPLRGAVAIAIDTSGNLYICETGSAPSPHQLGSSAVLRKIAAGTGVLTTIAGDGVTTYPNDGQPAVQVMLQSPASVAVDAAGNVYIAEQGLNRIRKVDTAGIITTVAGQDAADLSLPSGVAIDAAGGLYIADSGHNRIREVPAGGLLTTTVAGNGLSTIPGDGGPALGAQFLYPSAVGTDAQGNLYIADPTDNRVRMISSSGVITTVAGTGFRGYSGDDGPASAANLNGPSSVAVDIAGNVVIADQGNRAVRKVNTNGVITTVAQTAALHSPSAVAVDPSGSLFIADTSSRLIVEITPGGAVNGVGPINYFQSPTGLAADAFGDLYIADYSRVLKVSPDGAPTTLADLIDSLSSVAVDTIGNVYAAAGSRVYLITQSGTVTPIAGNGTTGYAGDGGPALNAQLGFAAGVAADFQGTIYLADAPNKVIRALRPATDGCSYSVSPTSLTPGFGAATPTLTVTTAAGCAWSVTRIPEWITIAGPADGIGPGVVTLQIAANSGLARSAQFIAAGLPVVVTQAHADVSITPNGVVNAASYAAPVVPGGLASIFGYFTWPAGILPPLTDLPTFSAGSGSSLPLLAIDIRQANVQIPWELTGKDSFDLTVSILGQSTAPQTVPLAAYSPAIFAITGDGQGQGAILDEVYRLVDSTNPAIAGTTVVLIYCTGLGPVTNQPATGQPALADPLSRTTIRPSVFIGGAPADAQFSGLAPGLVGVYQVNALVPQASTKGDAVPVSLGIGGVTTSNAVTIAVR